MRIGKICHVTVFEKVFDFDEDIVDWSDQVIVNLCYFPLEIVQLIR